MSLFCFGICGTMGPLVNHIVLLWSHFENQPPKQELPMAERGDSELIERFLFACTHTPLYRLCTLPLCTHTRQFAHRTLCTVYNIAYSVHNCFSHKRTKQTTFRFAHSTTALCTSPVSFLHDHRLQSAMLSSGKNLLREH